MTPRNQMKKGRSKSKNPGRTLKRLLSYIAADYKYQFILVLFFIVLGAIGSVATSLFLRVLIDDIIAPMLGNANPVFTVLKNVIILMICIYAVGITATYFQSRLMAVIGQGVQKKIRDQMFSHMQSLPIKYFDTHTHGDLMSRYTNDIDTLRQMLSQSIPQLCSSITTIAIVFIAMLYTSLPLSLLVVLCVGLMLFVTQKIAGKSSVYFVKQQKSIGTVNGYIEEMIQGQKVVKVFCREEESKKQFDALNAELCDAASTANQFANILMPIMANLGNLQYVLLAIAGGAMAVGGYGSLTLGAIASFLQLSRSFNMPINQVSQQLNSVIMALAGAERIFVLIDEIPEQDEGYVTLVNVQYDRKGEALVEAPERTGIWAWKHPHKDGTVTYTRLTGDVQFFNVDFGYDEGKLILRDVSLYAHPGEKIAFVGATGAGKTTITNLINRFYDIRDGKIRYDGINISKIKKSDLRRSLGVVLQDTHLFTGTIRENIRYGNLSASDEEVHAAARLANADGFISMLPDGYDTVITGDGAGLSQGQRQLLAIARAAVADPPVMILDEATSSIDTRTEAIVQQGMDSLMYGRTVFVIAHRLSTIQNSDAIMVMDMGEIIERGNHEKLIGERGKYHQLHTGAFELE